MDAQRGCGDGVINGQKFEVVVGRGGDGHCGGEGKQLARTVEQERGGGMSARHCLPGGLSPVISGDGQWNCGRSIGPQF